MRKQIEKYGHLLNSPEFWHGSLASEAERINAEMEAILQLLEGATAAEDWENDRI
jgi:hypothetical protein